MRTSSSARHVSLSRVSISSLLCVALLVFAALPALAQAPPQTESQNLLPSPGVEREQFGAAVAMEGSTIVVGASGSAFPDVRGAAYVWTRDSSGIWSQQVKLQTLDGPVHNEFGSAVAISGDTLLVGSYFDDEGGEAAGAVYVFVNDGTTWSQQAKLLASDAGYNGRFGLALSIDGDRAAIYGATDTGGGDRAGAVYVLDRDALGDWTETAVLTTSDGVSLGTSTPSHFVALSGDTIIAGAPIDVPNGFDSGSAYVFEYAAGVWSQTEKLVPPDNATNDLFGLSVALEGGTAAVGAPDISYIGSITGGKAYVYTRQSTGSWSEAVVPSPLGNQIGDGFGHSVALDGDSLAVGQRGGGDGSGYVYHRDALGAWQEDTQLVGSAGDPGGLGLDIALSAGEVLMGARSDPTLALYGGSAFIFSSETGSPIDYIRGDANGDGGVDLGDAITALNYMFGLQPVSCESALDVNDDETVDVSDPIYLLAALFTGAAAPPAPYPDCGSDPTPGPLGCDSQGSCP